MISNRFYRLYGTSACIVSILQVSCYLSDLAFNRISDFIRCDHVTEMTVRLTDHQQLTLFGGW